MHNSTKSLCIVAVAGVLLGLICGCALVDDPPRSAAFDYNTHASWSDSHRLANTTAAGDAIGGNMGQDGARHSSGTARVNVGE